MAGQAWGAGILVWTLVPGEPVRCFAVCFLPVVFLSSDYVLSSPMDKCPNSLTTQNTANLRRLLQDGGLPCQGLKDRIPIQLNVTNPEPRDKQVAWVLPATCHPDQVWLGLQIPPLTHTWDFPWVESTCPKDIKESSLPASLPAPPTPSVSPQCLAIGLLGSPVIAEWMEHRIFLHLI